MKRLVDQAICHTTGRRPLSRALVVVAGLLVLAALALPAYAQGPAVSATVDRDTIGMGETLTLSIAVEGASGQPALPAAGRLPGLGNQQRRADAHGQRQHHDPDRHPVPIAAAAHRAS